MSRARIGREGPSTDRGAQPPAGRAPRLDLFGSATGAEFDESRSDVDVLVDLTGHDDPFHAYFELKEGLESLFGRSVDAVVDEAIENPYVRRRVDEQRELLYAA